MDTVGRWTYCVNLGQPSSTRLTWTGKQPDRGNADPDAIWCNAFHEIGGDIGWDCPGPHRRLLVGDVVTASDMDT